jgi:hypothetical protein
MKRLLCLIFLFMASCASLGQPGNPSQSSSSCNFTLEFPKEWRKVTTGKYLMMTRDGAFSQYILVQQRHLDRPFSHTKKKIDKDMLPQEAAQVILDEMTSDRAVLNLQVLENLPAAVNGYNGFRLVFTYQLKGAHKFKTLYYGFLQGEWFYSLRYNAADGRYSDKDVETFRQVLESFKITAARSA